MKLTDLIVENFDKYRQEEEDLQKGLEANTKGDDCYVTMGDYSGGRPDNDPLKDMSYGKVTFRTVNDFENSDWEDIKKYIESKGYDITSDSNYADIEPGERNYYPTIKFHFKTPSK